MLRNIGTTEIIVVALVLLVLFGGRKLPELAHGIAESIKEFRKAFKGEDKKAEE
ncbi:MAG TPA: twin-arginine translocase TatA/TatE family subunit [Patescibacteria group bacterium]|uniref:Sec-independent protein translocase protein TatA n=1 Tax=Candidatus Gottesmanbacteria bacterium GW2011_GWB1_44_11c TaxID=1618447 RepID=A0A0G1GKA1_9BACT|nr:MAG: Sec-independent protein translocase protein TatA [Candidatus Gottesmanbacteria bacterium GW2011_GWB1_44_11c]HLE49976.1 twin-arginine translocase TatA/TatE family subunit [Patescibacteria group bacterium]